MRRKTRKALKLSAHHAGVALQMLIEEGKIAAGDVARALRNREKMIKELREKLAALETSARPMARRLASAGRKAVRRAAPRARKAITRAVPRARKAITHAQRAARQAQGRYMAAVRRLSEDARVKIREIRKESGVDAAIKAALKMAGGK